MLGERDRKLRIGLLSGPMVPIPPPGYAGTERVVAALVEELSRRGHEVTLIGPGDSRVQVELVPTIERSLWASGMRGDLTAYVLVSVERAWAESRSFDVIHSHLESHTFSFARHCGTPVLHTLHGRLDVPGMPELLEEFADLPLVAISESQRRWSPNNNWVATVHHGLALEDAPFSEEPGSYLALVGRVTAEKGVAEAIELARAVNLPLRIAAKVHEDSERELFRQVVQPAIDEGIVTFEGELGPADRDRLLANALATVMLGAWPEPFGLVAIESMATGTPVIGRRAGALTEIIDHGETGFLVDDLLEAEFAVREVRSLNRLAVRQWACERFTVERMVDQYEELYRALAEDSLPDTDPTRPRATLTAKQKGSPTELVSQRAR